MTNDEITSLRKGDVIASIRSHTPRIIRDVSIDQPRGDSLPHVRVTVAILRCSWTKGPTTILDRYILKTQYEKLDCRVKLDQPIDLEILKSSGVPYWDRSVGCCDVEGVDLQPREPAND